MWENNCDWSMKMKSNGDIDDGDVKKPAETWMRPAGLIGADNPAPLDASQSHGYAFARPVDANPPHDPEVEEEE